MKKTADKTVAMTATIQARQLEQAMESGPYVPALETTHAWTPRHGPQGMDPRHGSSVSGPRHAALCRKRNAHEQASTHPKDFSAPVTQRLQIYESG